MSRAEPGTRREALTVPFSIQVIRMSRNTDREDAPAEVRDAMGIVVQDGTPGRTRPRAVAFVWGPEVSPAPSLPFGRWKTAVPAAA